MLRLTKEVVESIWCRKIGKVRSMQKYEEIRKHEIELSGRGKIVRCEMSSNKSAGRIVGLYVT